MIKKLLIITLLFIAPSVFADTGYVSPENYAVNEADLTDYWSVPKSEPLNITSETKPAKIKPAKYTKEKPEKYKKPYEERLMYKMAKWWTDQRYKREEPHHGEKHEIKVNSTYRQEQMKKLAEDGTNMILTFPDNAWFTEVASEVVKKARGL